MKIRYQNTWFADFETTTEKQYIRDGETRVWLWYIENLKNENGKLGMSGEEFINWLTEQKGNHKVYFHNLMKFDGEFIFWTLLKMGYEPVEKIDLDCRNVFYRDKDGWGVTYYIEVSTGKNYIKFQCSLLLLTASVEKLGKLSKNYKKEKSVNENMDIIHDEKNLSEIEINWINRVISDVKIVKEAFINFKKYCPRIGLTKASTAFQDFKSFNHFYDTNIKDILSADDNLNFHKWYRGGFNYVNPLYQNIEIDKKIHVYDVNSLYPTVMRYFKMPYGTPIYNCDDECNHDCQLLEIMINKAKIKGNNIPFLNEKNAFKNEYYSEIDSYKSDDCLFHLTNVDFNLVKKYYDVKDYIIINKYCFKSTFGIFDDYIDKWYKRKLNSKSGTYEYETAKLMLNSLYGKFGSKSERIKKIYYKDDEGKYCGYSEKEIKEVSEKNVYYNPIAIFITSYARMYLINEIQKNPNDFIYCDTDSLHTLKIPIDMKIHDKKLGYWKYEGCFYKGKYLKNKQYLLQDDNGVMVKVAGLSKENQKLVNFDNFKDDTRLFHAKKMAKKVKGGIIITDTDFTFKVPKKKEKKELNLINFVWK